MREGTAADECDYREQERIFREECQDDFERDERLRGVRRHTWQLDDVIESYEAMADLEARTGDREYPSWLTVSQATMLDIIKVERARADRWRRAGDQHVASRRRRPKPPIPEEDA